MDSNTNELLLKKTLVDLEDAHAHLQASIKHLEDEIKKREIDIQKLISERELGELMTVVEYPDYRKRFKTQQSENINTEKTCLDIQYSSEFAKQVGTLLNNIARVSEEISGLIKL